MYFILLIILMNLNVRPFVARFWRAFSKIARANYFSDSVYLFIGLFVYSHLQTEYNSILYQGIFRGDDSEKSILPAYSIFHVSARGKQQMKGSSFS